MPSRRSEKDEEEPRPSSPRTVRSVSRHRPSFNLAPPPAYVPPSYAPDLPAALAGGYDLAFPSLQPRDRRERQGRCGRSRSSRSSGR